MSDAVDNLAVPVPERGDSGGGEPAIGQHALEAFRAISSLKLTVTLFALSIVLILAGTVAQVDMGIWLVMSKYFRCFFCWIEFDLFFPHGWDVPGSIPFPGGWTIGGLLLINLLSAHSIKFKVKAQGMDLLWGFLAAAGGTIIIIYSVSQLMADVADATGDMWTGFLPFAVGAGILGGSGITCWGFIILFAKRAGVVLLHAGIIIMILSEIITGVFAVETNMNITEGTFANYAADIREVELAIVESGKDEDKVVVIPQGVMLNHMNHTMASGGEGSSQTIKDASLPFDVEILRYYPNANIFDPRDATNPNLPPMEQKSAAEAMKVAEKNLATDGIGTFGRVVRLTRGTGTGGSSEVDTPAVYAKLTTDKETIGTYLLWSKFTRPQDNIKVGDKTYKVALRFRRHYKPYEMHLIDVRHDVFPGTNIPRNYSSKIRLIDKELGEDREVLVYMNHPLRYRGDVYFQSQVQKFRPDSMSELQEATVFQVVRNPAWIWPYISCAMVAAGMLVHFGQTLTRFMGRMLA